MRTKPTPRGPSRAHVVGPELSDLIRRQAVLERVEDEGPTQPRVRPRVVPSLKHAVQLRAAGSPIELLGETRHPGRSEQKS